MHQDPTGTSISVFGHEYTVRGVEDPEYARRVASYVDQQMRQVAKESGQVSSIRIAVLAALNITDELFRERESGSVVTDRLRERVEKMTRSLEESIASDPADSGLLERPGEETS
jgi:cell division protein ZapA